MRRTTPTAAVPTAAVPAAALTAALLLTLTATGCASKPSGPDSTVGRGTSAAAPSPPVRTKNDCTDFTASVTSGDPQGSTPPPGDLPPAAHPVALLECAVDTQDVPGQGQWRVVTTIRSTGSVDGFVSALRAAYVKPPQRTPKGAFACPAIGYVQQWIALVDADGTAYRIRTPMWGYCPAPDPDVVKALAAVKTTVVSTERISQTMSQGAQSSGCPQQFAEMAYVTAQMSGLGTATKPFFQGTNPADSLRTCYYKLAGPFDKRDLKPAGDFASAATITGSQAAVIHDGLMNAPIAATNSCGAPATEYAVISADAAWSVVELDGCELASSGSGPDRQVPAAVIQALLAAKQ